MKTATLARTNTMSGRPGSRAACFRKRSPRACTSFRSVISGVVSVLHPVLDGLAQAPILTVFLVIGLGTAAGQIPLVPLAIGNQISGDVLHNVGLGYAMAMGMVIIMAISITGYTWLQRRSERWLR